MTSLNVVYGVFDDTEDPDAPQLLGVFSTRDLAEAYLASTGYTKEGETYGRREKTLGWRSNIFLRTASIGTLIVDGELT